MYGERVVEETANKWDLSWMDCPRIKSRATSNAVYGIAFTMHAGQSSSDDGRSEKM